MYLREAAVWRLLYPYNNGTVELYKFTKNWYRNSSYGFAATTALVGNDALSESGIYVPMVDTTIRASVYIKQLAPVRD